MFVFSIVMAVYNVERYLAEALESLLQQSIGFRDHVQVILVDDGSPDGSGRICDDYRTRYPGNIEVIHQVNAGVAAARNAGMKLVRGRYVCFMDSDDLLTSDTLAAVAAFFGKHDGRIDLVAIPMQYFEGSTAAHVLNVKFRKGDRVIDLEQEWSFPQLSMSSAFVRAEALEGLAFDTRLKHLEDMKVAQQVLLRKRAYGVVRAGKYMYRRRALGAQSAVQSATKRKAWYLDTLTYAEEELFDQVEASCGGVLPKFIQCVVMYDLQWRLAMEEIPSGVLTKDEESAYRDKLVSLLRRIDDDVIRAQRNIYSEHKVFALLAKSSQPLEIRKVGRGGFAFHSGDRVVMALDKIPLQLEFMRREGDSLVVDARLLLPGADLGEMNLCADFAGNSFVARWLGEKVVSYAMGSPILRACYYRFQIPLRDMGRDGRFMSFRLSWGGRSVPFAKVTFGRFFPLSGKYLSAYWRTRGFAVSCATRQKLWIEPAGFRLLFRRERRFLMDLWRKRQPGARKAVVARLIVHAAHLLRLRPFWLIADRAMAARDNGEAFFRYMRAAHPEQRVFFVLNRDAPHFEELKRVGPVLPRGSFRYKLMALLADWIVSSQAEEQVTDPFWGYDAPYRDLLANHRFLFLGHGITQNDISSWIGRYKKDITGIVAAAAREAEAFRAPDYGYAPENVWLTGLPRYDRLYHDERRQILVMPTWRRELMGALDPRTGVWSLVPGFRESDYFRFYNGLINHPRLLAAARQAGYRVAFFPHPNLQPHADQFDHAEEVVFVDPASEYRDVLAQGDVLVTDYSSVAFDFAYLRKPVIYSQFDKAQFYQRTSVLKPGYFDYEQDGFGPVVLDLERLVDELVGLMARGCRIEARYLERVNAFFAFNDTDNCRRVYEQMVQVPSLRQ